MATDGSSSYVMADLTTAARLLTRKDNQFDVICVVPEFQSAPELKKTNRENTKAFRRRYYDYVEQNGGRLLKRASEAFRPMVSKPTRLPRQVQQGTSS